MNLCGSRIGVDLIGGFYIFISSAFYSAMADEMTNVLTHKPDVVTEEYLNYVLDLYQKYQKMMNNMILQFTLMRFSYFF